MNISLYGEESTPFVFLYYIANTLIFWTVGVYNIKKHSFTQGSDGILHAIKKIFSPPLIGFILGVLLIALKIRLPEFLDRSFNYIGQLSTPLSMFFIGTVIYQMDFGKWRLDRATVLILLGKFIISPLMIMGLLLFFDFPDLLEKVFIIQGAGPIIAQAALVAEYYEVNASYAAFMVGLSTILYMFILPIYALILA
jgi:predicted permease